MVMVTRDESGTIEENSGEMNQMEEECFSRDKPNWKGALSS
jgi:hypothetical protein